MIIKGKSRAAAGQLAAYLLTQGKNESVKFLGADNVLSNDLRGALQEMQAIAALTNCDKFLYHASINPKEGEHLTPEQWAQSVDLLEKNLGLEGHQRAAVEHIKEGRAHYHVVWSRVDVDTLTAARMSHNYRAHELTSRELEREFGLDRVQGAHVEKDGPRPERQPKQWEVDRGRRSGIDPRNVKAEVSELWAGAKNGADFATALEARGYILAQGDKRDFVIIDRNGDPHGVTRRTGATAAEVRAKLADIDKADLPTVGQAKEIQHERREREDEVAIEKAFTSGGDMVSQQQAAMQKLQRQHEEAERQRKEARAKWSGLSSALTSGDTVTTIPTAAALVQNKDNETSKNEPQERQQNAEQGRQQEQSSFAGRKDTGQQKRVDKTARTEQTDRKQGQKQSQAERLWNKRFETTTQVEREQDRERERER